MSLEITRQKYKDCPPKEIPQAQCIQLKYDGRWCNVISTKDGSWDGFTRTEKHTHGGNNLRPDCQITGEYVFGTQWSMNNPLHKKVVAFDCVLFENQDVRHLTYRQRLSLLKMAVCDNPDFIVAPTYRMESFNKLWDQCEAGVYEGLVFRNLGDTYHDQVHRMKMLHEETYIALSFVEGKGKHAGRLGAVVACSDDGVEVVIGGGFSDDQREHIWDNQQLYHGKSFDVTYYVKFPTGKLRHANFLRWKE